MKKIIKISALALIALLMLASCASSEIVKHDGAMGSFPARSIPVTAIEDLQSGSFEIIGTVTGKGRVNHDSPSDGDSLGYGTLEVLDVDRMYYGVSYMPDLSDPYAVALANAIDAMIKDAREQGAAFLTFPSYTLEIVEGNMVEAVATAVAVRIVNPSQVVIVNRSQAPDSVTYVVDATTK